MCALISLPVTQAAGRAAKNMYLFWAWRDEQQTAGAGVISCTYRVRGNAVLQYAQKLRQR